MARLPRLVMRNGEVVGVNSDTLTLLWRMSSKPTPVDSARAMLQGMCREYGRGRVGVALGIPRSTLGAWLKGTRSPSRPAERLIVLMDCLLRANRGELDWFFLGMAPEEWGGWYQPQREKNETETQTQAPYK